MILTICVVLFFIVAIYVEFRSGRLAQTAIYSVGLIIVLAAYFIDAIFIKAQL